MDLSNCSKAIKFTIFQLSEAQSLKNREPIKNRFGSLSKVPQIGFVMKVGVVACKVSELRHFHGRGSNAIMAFESLTKCSLSMQGPAVGGEK